MDRISLSPVAEDISIMEQKGKGSESADCSNRITHQNDLTPEWFFHEE